MTRITAPQIMYEDADIIVCRKPAGLPTQTSRVGCRDLVSILKNHLAEENRKQAKGISEKGKRTAQQRQAEPYLAVIHRLDQPVDGLLVFAKTAAAAKDLNRQLTGSDFGKYYRAVVNGVPDPPEGTLEDYLIKDGRANTSRVCPGTTPGAKPARLHYRVIKTVTGEDSPASLVEIHLDTGRHHQIRVQMAHLGCPLAGDRKYGHPPAEKTAADQKSSAPLKLCAFRLEFRHPRTGRKMQFELPDVFL